MRLTVKRVGYVLFLVFLLGQMVAAGVTVRAANNVLYAAPIAQGTGDCSSWANACTLTTALQQAQDGDEIWVKEGTYKPDTSGLSDPREATFRLVSGVAMYGGFAGTETSRAQRDWQAHPTILSGDIGTPGDATDNVYHVIIGASNATLDGFTVTGGSTAWGKITYGGGMFNEKENVTVANVIFEGNRANDGGPGGGLASLGDNLQLTNVTFRNNSADSDGGGLYIRGADITLTKVTFDHNSTGNRGGGMFISEGSANPTLTDVTFTQNSAGWGGGLYTFKVNVTLTNVTFDHNSVNGQSARGGGFYSLQGSAIFLRNVTFTSNSASYEGGGIFIDASNNMNLTSVTFDHNSAHSGGGLYNLKGVVTLTNVTFASNSTSYQGGGMSVDLSDNTHLTNVTFDHNTASEGGGMYNNGSTITLVNVLIAGSGGGACRFSGTGVSFANSKNNLLEDSTYTCGLTDGVDGNIVGHSANVGTLGYYGGATQTVPLNPDSPAIDAGDAASCPNTDQRGVSRPQGSGCDIGAYERDDTSPTVMNAQGMVSMGEVPLTEDAVLSQGFSQLTVRFSEAMNNPDGDTDPDDVTNPLNYRLVRDNGDGIQTTSCASGIQGNDIPMVLGPVSYDDHGGNGPFEATMLVNGGTPLPAGHYRLLVCGSTSLADIALNHLAGDGVDAGTDFVRNFTVEAATAQEEQLPATGFAPGRVTMLPVQPADKAYKGLTLQLDVPRLGLKAEIVGVPRSADGWDVSWLGGKIGWLEGTAFPTWEGNSVLTGHVTDANGLPGPFAQLHRLRYDDAIVVHMAGQRYEFRVREVRLVRPTDTRFTLKHLEGYPYLTLVTCRGYDAVKDTYRWRWVVRAVLVSVRADSK